MLTDPRALVAPPEPYRPDLARPWQRGGAPLIELPIAVTPGLRVPAIGTSLLLAPPRVRDLLLGQMARRMRYAGEMQNMRCTVNERRPVSFPGEVRERHAFNACRLRDRGRIAGGSAHLPAVR